MDAAPSISATLIAKNEARCIARCLDSVRPFVDSILVLDTGSTDGTPEIAQAHGAEVHRFAWADDFALARNRALDLADADWHLVLDADETIDSGGALLREWCAGAPRLGRVCIHNQFDDLGQIRVNRSWITRLIPRGARFAGRIHEQVAASLPRERIELHVLHDGYRDAQMAGKRNRNHALLLRDIAENPDDAYTAYQLGREAEGADAFAQACDWYAKAFARTDAGASWFHDLLVRFLHVLGQAGRTDEALALANGQMQAWSHSPDFFFVVGNLALDRAIADPAQALDDWLPLAVTCWDRCLEIGEQPELEGSVQGRGSHLAQHNLDLVRSQLAALGR